MTELRIRPTVPTAFQASGIETFADLFCGIGGFHYAASDLGLECVFACDIDDDCRDQYLRNFGQFPQADIKRIPANRVPDHDILFAGFPCQPFSIIGSMQGFKDDRGNLFHEIVRILKVKQPKAVILENVRQLSTMQGGKVLREVLTGLTNVGYENHKWKILNALDYGLPQKRERIIIVAFLDEAIELFRWPEPKPNYKPLTDILESHPDQRHYVSERIRLKRHREHTATIKPAIWHENKGGNISSHPFSCALRANASYNYLLVDGERRLTPREQLRLQGFPDNFNIQGGDTQIRKQTGNAVPVPMIRAVIREVMRAASKKASKNAGRETETRTIPDQRVSGIGH